MRTSEPQFTLDFTSKFRYVLPPCCHDALVCVGVHSEILETGDYNVSSQTPVGVTQRREPKEAWIVDYRDQHGARHIKTFAKKRDADAHHAIVGTGVRAGTHTAESKSITVAKAGELWLGSCEGAGLERTTLDAYERP